MLEQGLGNLLKKAVSGEGMQLMKIEGQGRVYLADAGKRITLLRLAGEAIFVNGNDVLAVESGIESRITMMRKVAGMLSGGLFNVRLSGHGIVAITSHYEPLTLPVNAQTGPVFTDPNATVAWSGSLTPEIVTDISLGTLLGRGPEKACSYGLRATAGWWCSPTKKSCTSRGNKRPVFLSVAASPAGAWRRGVDCGGGTRMRAPRPVLCRAVAASKARAHGRPSNAAPGAADPEILAIRNSVSMLRVGAFCYRYYVSRRPKNAPEGGKTTRHFVIYFSLLLECCVT